MARKIELDDTYEGAFEIVGVNDLKQNIMESVQSVAPEATDGFLGGVGLPPSARIARQPELEVNTVNWAVADDNTLSGRAKFLAVRSHDLVNATLHGNVEDPAPGTDFRLTKVVVTFVGGTGAYAKASGTANVVAKLFNNGLSVGHIRGEVVLP